jgi:hypothetical protein
LHCQFVQAPASIVCREVQELLSVSKNWWFSCHAEGRGVCHKSAPLWHGSIFSRRGLKSFIKCHVLPPMAPGFNHSTRLEASFEIRGLFFASLLAEFDSLIFAHSRSAVEMAWRFPDSLIGSRRSSCLCLCCSVSSPSRQLVKGTETRQG